MTSKAHKPGKQPVEAAKAKALAEHSARLTFAPEINAAAVADVFNATGTPDLQVMINELRKHGDAIERGDTKGIERMLIAQAHALDAMFASLARRAKVQENLAPYDAYMKFALRAQAQCRATLETLATIKNPPNVAFVKQANIAHGHQQVNNGMPEPVARVETENRQTELLEHEHGERLDTGTAGAASEADPVMATVGKVHRA